MEICIGEYVRTKNGIIDKIKTINKYGTVTKYDDKEDKISVAINYYINSGLEVNEDDIVKHSKNIIDLIEVGDFVNKEEIIEVRKQNGKIYLMTSYCPQNYIKHEIKEILTKEQYMKNCYTVERKEKC